MPQKAVIFDFDGVIADTISMCYDIHKAVAPDFSYAEYQKMAHGNFLDGYETYRQKRNLISNADFYSKYDAGVCGTSVQSAIAETIEVLAKKYRLFIVSSGMTPMIRKFLDEKGLSGYFEEILGYDFHSSKVYKFERLLEKGISAEGSVFITDTLSDILDANKKEIPTIAVTWGLHDKETLEKGNPAAIVEKTEDLLPAIEKILS